MAGLGLFLILILAIQINWPFGYDLYLQPIHLAHRSSVEEILILLLYQNQGARSCMSLYSEGFFQFSYDKKLPPGIMTALPLVLREASTLACVYGRRE